MKSVVKNYASVIEALSTAAVELGTKTATHANGLKTGFSSVHTLHGLLMSFPLLCIMEQFNTALQSPNVTVAGMLEGAETIKKQLEEIQTEKKFNEIFVILI